MSSIVASLQNVTKDYHRFRALHDVSLEIRPGVTGLLGPNGAGKSTLIKVLLGLVSCQQGEVEVLGMKQPQQGPLIRRQIGYLPEDDCYIAGLSGVEMLQFAIRLSGASKTEGLRRSHEILDFCGMGQERYRAVETYSTGMRQKLKFAQAIVHDPAFVILDEPTSGLDPEERQNMLQRIETMVQKSNKAVLISTHILPDVQAICDRAVILVSGKVRLHEALETLSPPSSNVYQVEVVGDPERLAEQCRRQGMAAELQAGGLAVTPGESVSIAAVWECARQVDVGVRSLTPSRVSLEDIFGNAVKEGQSATE